LGRHLQPLAKLATLFEFLGFGGINIAHPERANQQVSCPFRAKDLLAALFPGALPPG
jgi:hypothetical protein